MTNFNIQSQSMPALTFPSVEQQHTSFGQEGLLNQCLFDDTFRSESPLNWCATPELLSAGSTKNNSIELANIESYAQQEPSAGMFAGKHLSLNDAFDIDPTMTQIFDLAPMSPFDESNFVKEGDANIFASPPQDQSEIARDGGKPEFFSADSLTRLAEEKGVSFVSRDGAPVVKPTPLRPAQMASAVSEPQQALIKTFAPVVQAFTPMSSPRQNFSLDANQSTTQVHEALSPKASSVSGAQAALPQLRLATRGRKTMLDSKSANNKVKEGRIERAFSCNMPKCGRAFKRAEHLKRHMRTHTGEKKYMCSVCDKKFSRSDNVRQHQVTHPNATAMRVVNLELEAGERTGLL